MRRAVITGGEGALARALAEVLSREGRFEEVLSPGRADLDVTSADSVRSFFSNLDRVDLLINNAGSLRDGPQLTATVEDWDVVVDSHLKGAFLCSREAIRLMFRVRSGHIVNLGSFSAFSPPVGQGNYAAAKAGMIALTQSLAEEVGKRGVRVNCVLPGFLEGTQMTSGLAPAAIERAREAHVLKKFNTLNDAARFIAFLDEMEAVSGQVFQLDSRLRRW